MTAAIAPLGITLRDLVADDTPAIMELAQAAFSTPWTKDFVIWKYFQNPAGRAFGACAETAGRVVASYSNLPVRLKLGAATVTAAQAVDAMVSADYRRQKLFYQLARRTYQALDEANINLTYVFPATAIRAAFVNQLNYAEVGPVPRFVKVVRAAELGRSLGHSGPKSALDQLAWFGARAAQTAIGPANGDQDVHVGELRQLDDRFDRLWQQASQGFPIATVRDAAYLTWRYRQNPLRNYLILAAERGHELVGYVVLSFNPEQQIAYLVELIVAPADQAAGHALLEQASQHARQAGCAQMQCWMLPHQSFYVGLLKRSGFVFWPTRALPGWLGFVTPFILRPGPAQSQQPDATRLGNWFIAMGDHDYY